MPHLLEAPAPAGHDRLLDRPPLRRRQGARGQPRAGLQPQRHLRPVQAGQPALRARAAAARHGSGLALTSTAAHPGVSGTNLVASRDGLGSIPVIGTLSQWGVRLLFPSPDKGAEAILFAATDAAPGSYSGPTGLRETRGPVGEARQSPSRRTPPSPPSSGSAARSSPASPSRSDPRVGPWLSIAGTFTALECPTDA